jgi:hypothetical protein
VVFVSGPIDLAGEPIPSAPAPPLKVEIRAGHLVPRITAARLGTELQILLTDDGFADLAAYFGLSELAFRHKFVLAGDRFSFSLSRPGLIVLENENRPTDRGYLYVTPADNFAIADGAGNYALPGVPSGKHWFTAWNEQSGVLEREAAVEPGQGLVLDFEFPSGKMGTR